MEYFDLKVGDEVNIGDNVSIVLQPFTGERARIQVKAPRRITVFREEVKAAILAGTPDFFSNPKPSV